MWVFKFFILINHILKSSYLINIKYIILNLLFKLNKNNVSFKKNIL